MPGDRRRPHLGAAPVLTAAGSRRRRGGAAMPDMSNLLLESLSASDAASIRPHLKPVYLKSKQILFEAEGRVPAVYFPTGAVISLVVGLSSGASFEAAMVGRDGVVGAASALDGKIAVSRAVVQLSGSSLMCEVGALRGTA